MNLNPILQKESSSPAYLNNLPSNLIITFITPLSPGFMTKLKPISLMLLALLLFSGNSEGEPNTGSHLAHSTNFIEIKGLPYLCKVSDDVYRCAQPTLEGIGNLKAMGIRTVINLCAFHSDRDMLKNTGLGYENIHMIAWPLIPEEKQVIRFLTIVTDSKRTPVLVHCQHGADRTGTMCAVYRIVVQGWTKEEAIKEMTDGGFGFHRVWGNNLIQWINDLDIDKIRKTAGVKKNDRPAIPRAS